MSSKATTAAAGHHEHDDGRVHAHISPFLFLIGIFGALIVLTILTVAASYVNFGSWNTVIAVLIATMKASLVALFFMHLRHDKPFHAFTFVMAFVFLGIFLILTLDDLTTRGEIDDASGTHVLPRTGLAAPGGLAGQYVPVANAEHPAAAGAPAASASEHH